MEVDLSTVKENARNLKKFIGEPMLMSVVKANAYGMGLAEVSKALAEDTDWFGVATPQEAFTIREQGVKTPILILGYVSEKEIVRVVEEEITICTVSLAYIHHLVKFIPEGKKLLVHLKIDTGLNRIGLYSQTHDIEEYKQQAVEILELPQVQVTGIYSHFAVSESKKPDDVTFTKLQYQRFMAVCNALESAGYNVGIKHIANSNAILEYPEYNHDMIRTGKFLFGFGQNVDLKRLNVKLAFKLYARIVRVVTIEPGETVGYGRNYKVDKPTKIATISFGFADGYRREMGEKLNVLIDGQRAHLVGRVAMDYLMVDATHIEHVEAGDTAILIGAEGDEVIMPNEISSIIHGSTPEVNSQINQRVPRYYR